MDATTKFILIILTLIGIAIITLIIYFYIKNENKEKRERNKKRNSEKQNNYNSNTITLKQKPKLYYIKEKYISNCEQEFFRALKEILQNRFIIYPQVPLSQIIEKKRNGYANELFRIVDFCIFNYQMKPLVCIEINDSTHNEFKRIQRDKKVQEILADAGLPLITLWTSYGVKPDYIRKRLQDYIKV